MKQYAHTPWDEEDTEFEAIIRYRGAEYLVVQKYGMTSSGERFFWTLVPGRILSYCMEHKHDAYAQDKGILFTTTAVVDEEEERGISEYLDANNFPFRGTRMFWK